GAGSGTPTEPHHTPSPEAQTPSHTTHPTSSLPPVTTTSIPTVTPTKTTPIKHYTRRTRIAQEGAAATNSGDDALIKGRSMDEGEAVAERVSDDTKEIEIMLTSMDAATVLAKSTMKVMDQEAKRDYYMAVIKNNLGWKVKDFKGMTFEEVEEKFNSVCKQM
nr:hypothetical protein [Tanacetum cinerariifolium]